MESYIVHFPSKAFMHVAPPWAQALHALPHQFLRFRTSCSSDDLMLTESDLEAMAQSAVDESEDPAHGKTA